MRLRPRRRNLVVWSSTAASAGRSRAVFMLGILVLIVTLLKGISAQERRRDPAS